MELGIGILIVVVAVTFTLGRMFLKRNEWVEAKPKTQHIRAPRPGLGSALRLT